MIFDFGVPLVWCALCYGSKNTIFNHDKDEKIGRVKLNKALFIGNAQYHLGFILIEIVKKKKYCKKLFRTL